MPSEARSRRIGGALLALALASATPERLSAELFGVRAQMHQQSPTGNLVGPESTQDALGGVLAVGDFDGDGFDDLAVSEYEHSFAVLSGAVHVIYGDADGISAADDQLWFDFDPETLLLDPEAGDQFGRALAAGDFNDDGFDDLAIGVPGENVEATADAGVVLVIYGSALGLQTGFEPGTLESRRFQLGVGGIGGGPATANESFGSVLAAGDFSGDGRDDLAVGIPEKSSGSGEVHAGSVLVIYGGAAGLSSVGHLFLDQDSNIGASPMVGTTNPSDYFGAALAAGDFNADGEADLAIGVPFEGGSDLSGCPAASGAVQVVYGTPGAGLVTSGNQLWYEGNVATGGACEANDAFGWSLVAGDLTDDGTADLVIGAPREDLASVVDAGAITYLLGGSETGISTLLSELFFEDDFEPFGNAQAGDEFGAALAIGDFREDVIAGRRDLAIGIPWDNVWNGLSSVEDAGSVIVTIGGPGLGPTVARLWAPGVGGVGGALEIDLKFGQALAAGDFDGDGFHDLAVGAPDTDATILVEVGAVHVLFGALFADGFEGDDTSGWSLVVP